MEDALAQKYDRIQQFATRDWLGPSSASLARLERVKANVHNITPTLSKNLRPTSASRTHKTYTELDTAPPLASKALHSTASAWGSDASIPELIKQQGERQSQRQESTKGPRRPWSGRKVPSSPTQRRPSSESSAAEAENESQRRLNAFINVKGAKYDPKSRPPSGRGPRQTTGTALAELMVGLEELSQQQVESTLEEFIRHQPSPRRHDLARLSAMYGDHPSLVVPPPAPHGSPIPDEQVPGENVDEEIAVSEDEDNAVEHDSDSHGTPYKEISVKQPTVPQLLRRPTPEPVRLSMTIPAVEDDTSEPEQEVDDFIDSDGPQEESSDGKQPTDLELQSVTSEVLSQLEEPSNSPSELPYRDQPTSSNSEQHVRVVLRGLPEKKDKVADGEVLVGTSDPEEVIEKKSQYKPKSKHSVHIMEERNVTIDITPRDILKPFVPHPPVGKRQPQSAANASRNVTETASSAPGSRATSVSPAQKIPARAKTARPRSAKVPIVGVEYGDDTEQSKMEGPQSKSDGVQHSKTQPDVETMMSRMALSEETDDIKPATGASSVTRQISQTSFKRNYYELSRELTYPTQAAVLTTKTIQFGDQGPTEEKSVSVIRQATEPFRSALLRQDKRKDVGEGLRGRAGSTSSDDASCRTHSIIRRPTKPANNVGMTALPRPESRMSHRQGDTDISTTPGEMEMAEQSEPVTNGKVSLVPTRPVSAPSKGHSAEIASGRKSPGKMRRRPHSAKPPANMRSDVCKLASKSSTAIVVTPKKRAIDYKRNREAVKALREGTLNKEKKYSKLIVAADEPKPIIRRPRKQESESSEEEEPQIVPLSAQEQEMEDMHQQLLERGVNVSAHTLARGLLPPTQRGYDDCLLELPEKSSLGLLNQPEVWLGKLFRKYKLAEKALAIANERMAIQAEAEAKVAAKGPAKKKKKSGGKKKLKHKRSNTVT
ncbi:uncharacterized protein LOC110975736 [Acanthaster planci]|uniref:Uncharacterized protein LOC110975736 n=1 Tax=Acanthaster planci TaxID=133434 RepID=A0A8B7XTJ6_ACAPL|nr:uncharacterized protein LOC110975736 [Acanthaster planci]